VHYAGKIVFKDGKLSPVFDKSDWKGKPFVFTLGRNEVIKGWELAV